MSNKEPREALGARDGETLLDAAKRVVRERDELRAEITKAQRSFDDDGPSGWMPGETAIDALIRTRDEARAEVERLAAMLPVHPSSLTDACTSAFERGAEAMREACAKRIEGDGNGYYGLKGAGVAKILRALPIPEDKP